MSRLPASLLVLASLLTVAPSASGAGLVRVEVHEDGVAGVDALMGAARAAVTPDGWHLYVTAVIDDSLSIFSRDPANGRLQFVSALRDGVDGVTGLDYASPLAVSPDGNHVYAGGYDSHALAVFERDPSSGALTTIQVLEEGVWGAEGLTAMQGLAMSPDGGTLYVVSYELAVYQRDVTTGLLSFVQILEDGEDGVELPNPVNAAVSPDGANVYVVCTTTGDAVAVFDRDGTTGALTFTQIVRDGVGGVDGLAQASHLTVSPDGAHVYATGPAENAVAVFDRDGATGLLTFVEVQRNGVGGVEGMEAPSFVAVSPDGAYVYVGSYGGSAATMFARAPATGRLTFMQGSPPDFDGHIIVSPDGRQVYAPSYAGRLAVFRPFTHACSATPLAGCRPPTSRKSSIAVRDDADPARERLAWKWRGPSASSADFGDPRADTDYALCVYDASGAAQPIVGAVAPAGGGCRGNRPCWRATATGFSSADKGGQPNGIVRVVMKQKAAGEAKFTIKGKGGALRLPAAQAQLPVRVQLQRAGSGPCWEGVFSTATVDQPGRLKARSE